MPSFSRLNKYLTQRQARSRADQSLLPHKVRIALERLLAAHQKEQPPAKSAKSGKPAKSDRPQAGPIHIGVAVSGGPDSVALLSALAALRSTQDLQLAVLHVNHGLRPEADQEQASVEQLCQRWHLQCVSKKLDPPASHRGIEAWARDERYRFFQTAMEQLGLEYVALAHTVDDQAETVLFRLLRGSARRGLAGIPPIRALEAPGEVGTAGVGQKGWLIRPLLDCSKEEVLAYLAACQLPFATDSSNTDLRYARNRIRHRLLPFLEEEFSPQVRPHLAQLATTLREEEDWLEASATLARARVQDTKNRLNVHELAAQPAALRSRIIRQWIEHAAQSHDLGFDHLEQVRALAEGRIHGMSGIIELPGSSQVRIEHGYLDHLDYLIMEPKQGQHVSEPYAHVLACGQELSLAQIGWHCTLSFPRKWSGAPEQARVSDPWTAIFDAAALSSALSPAPSFGLSPSVAKSLIVRSVWPGDRILPLGMAGHKKIQDVFVDAKLPRHVRQVFPLVVLEIKTQEIAWVPGHARGKQALVTGTTCDVCQLEVSPLPEKPELC